MSAMIITRLELKLNPRGGDQRPALESPLESRGERHEGGFLRGQRDGFERVREVGAGGAVAVPEVVVEEVGAGLGGFVGEDDAGAVVEGGAFGVIRDEEFLHGAVGELGWWGGVGVGVGVGD